MKQEHDRALKASIGWMRRFWPLIFILVLYAAPIIAFMVTARAPLGEAIHDANVMTWVIHSSRADLFILPHGYAPNDILTVAIILAILVFIIFSIVRYLYKSKK